MFAYKPDVCVCLFKRYTLSHSVVMRPTSLTLIQYLFRFIFNTMVRKLDNINSGGSRVCRVLGQKIPSGPHYPALINILQMI